MDTFVPPGWMTRTELVERTGGARFKDAWLGAMPTTAQLLAASPELRAMLVPDARDATRRARAGLPALSPQRVLSQGLAELLAAQKAEEPGKAAMHDQVVEELRKPLCSGIIPAGIKTSSGVIQDLLPHFWQGEDAILAFDTEEAIHGRELQTYMGRVFKPIATGRVLFKRVEAEAWLASLEAPPPEAPPPEAIRPRPTVAALAAFLSDFADGTKSEPECRTAAEDRFGTKLRDTKNLWRAAWKTVPSEKKLPRGIRSKQ